MLGAASAILPITNLFMTVLRFRASRCVGHKKSFGKISIAKSRPAMLVCKT
jgi:hypothetical protein